MVFVDTMGLIKCKENTPVALMDGFLNRIKKRIASNDDYRCLFIGMTGSGKSGSAIGLASLLDPNFSVDNVFFTVEDLAHKIKELSQTPKSRRRKGQAFVLDEAGVFANARNWQSKTNKALSYIAQTQRYLNCYVIYTLPMLTLLDKQVRSLFHNVYLVKKRVNATPKPLSHTIVEVFDVAFNPLLPKKKEEATVIRLVKPKVKIKGERLYRLDYVRIFHPPKALWDEYTLKKEIEMERLYSKIEEDLGGVEDYDQERYISEIVEKIIKLKPHLDIFNENGSYSIKKIQKEFGISSEVARLVIQKLKQIDDFGVSL